MLDCLITFLVSYRYTTYVGPLTESDGNIIGTDYVNGSTSSAINVVCADEFYHQTLLTAQHIYL